MYNFKINSNTNIPKYKQIVNVIVDEIERGVLKKDDKLPTINGLSEGYFLSRDTVEKAYRELRDKGYILSVQGKGNFIRANRISRMKILLVFNKLSSYKKIIYYSFLEALGNNAKVDLQIHNHSSKLLKEIIENNVDKYNYIAIMPHFKTDEESEEGFKVIDSIPQDKLILMDKDLPNLKKDYLSVYQDFEKDLVSILESALELLNKYDKLTLVFPTEEKYPNEIIKGFRLFCLAHHKDFSVVDTIRNETIKLKTAYLVMAETDLAELLKIAKDHNYILGEDLGILSYNETPLKDILDITVISTDFETMGRMTAALILDNKKIKVKNSFNIIIRNSL
jgi:DNA-binding transcriptional regulator YhcF (GntR family)